MPYTYTLTTVIPATPQQIYEAWLDSEAHSEMTGGEASMSGEVGAEVSAWDGYITGSNLELVPGERIVQSWRTSKFTDEHEDSIITVMLEPVDGGTLLTLVHSNVPNEHRSYEQGGWESQYFEPMKVYFAGIEQDEVAEEPLQSAPSPAELMVRRAPAEKAKKAPAAKTAGAKEKTKRAAPAKAKRKTAKPGARKAARRAAPKRLASKKAASKKAASKKAVPKRARRKRSAPKRTASKSKSGRRKRARR